MIDRRKISEAELQDLLVDYYQEQSISKGRVDEIVEDEPFVHSNRFVLPGVAVAIVLVTIGIFFNQKILTTYRIDSVLQEIALNHASKLRMDAQAQSLAELQFNLPELPFKMRLPEDDFFAELMPVGGRLCTINGNLAAHVKLRSPETQELFSIFLTRHAPNLEFVQSPGEKVSTEKAGVDVRLWREENYVFAFARSAM